MDIKRRGMLAGIFGTVAALAGGALGGSMRRKLIPVHVYVWNTHGNAITCDPRFDEIAMRCNPPDIYLDGEFIPRGELITACLSGERGWVEVELWDEWTAALDRGENIDRPARMKRFGCVEVVPAGESP